MQYLNDFLSRWWEWLVGMLPEAARPYAMPVLAIVIVLNVNLGVCSYLILLERKLSAWMQDRLGPNRVGPMGLFQPVADMLKLLLKEDVIPGHVNKFLFVLAPGISVFTTFLAFSVVPFGPVPQNLSPGDGQFPFIIAPGIVDPARAARNGGASARTDSTEGGSCQVLVSISATGWSTSNGGRPVSI